MPVQYPYRITTNTFYNIPINCILQLAPITFGQDILNKCISSNPNKEVLIFGEGTDGFTGYVIWARQYDPDLPVCLVIMYPTLYGYSRIMDRLLASIPECYRENTKFSLSTYLNIIGAMECRQMDFTVASGGYWERWCDEPNANSLTPTGSVPQITEPVISTYPYPSVDWRIISNGSHHESTTGASSAPSSGDTGTDSSRYGVLFSDGE